MNKLNIVVINRWNDKTCNYHEFIDHSMHSVFYINNEKGSKGINHDVATGSWVADDLNVNNCDMIIGEIIKDSGMIDRVIALSEVDQELAAYIRTKYGIPGMQAELVSRFRNKIHMKEVLRLNSILTPEFYDLNDTNQLKRAKESQRFPLILKPKEGVSSEGVIKVEDKVALLHTLKSVDLSGYECEEFIDGKIFHADGLIHEGKIIFFNVSEYVNTCFDYTLGMPLGSVMLDGRECNLSYLEYTRGILDAMGLDNSAFHLEFILKDNKIYFIEIGARVGGASVASLIQELYDINLFHCWIDIQLGNDVSAHINKDNNINVGGWLLFPEPRDLPCMVTNRVQLNKMTPVILSEYLPEIGHEFKGNGEYRDTSGTYLLRGKSSDEVRDVIYKIINKFKLHTQPIGA